MKSIKKRGQLVGALVLCALFAATLFHESNLDPENPMWVILMLFDLLFLLGAIVAYW